MRELFRVSRRVPGIAEPGDWVTVDHESGDVAVTHFCDDRETNRVMEAAMRWEVDPATASHQEEMVRRCAGSRATFRLLAWSAVGLLPGLLACA